MRDAPNPADLLDWYDANARVMPWRVAPDRRRAGEAPEPYHVWLSEVMLQQTTVAAVKDYFQKFITLWPSIENLAAAEDAEVMAAWAGLGYYARARNLLKCARVITAHHGGTFPSTQAELLKLPGIGPYTAAAIAAIAFDAPAVVVDGNVERVMARLFDDHTPLPAAKKPLTERAAELTPSTRAGDYAQAVMDLGATICTPRNPACGICPWMQACEAHVAGTAQVLPRKTPKKPKPVRFGIAYVLRRSDGAWLLETRPESGLLGGMLGWPGSEWTDQPKPAPPCDANWTAVPGEVRHTFTHFHLVLELQTAIVDMHTPVSRGHFLPAEQFRPTDLPTVMRKAFDLARSAVS